MTKRENTFDRWALSEFAREVRARMARNDNVYVLVTDWPVKDAGMPYLDGIAGKYRNTVEHLGFGAFRGRTPNGTFSFDAGGAMASARRIDGRHSFSYSYVLVQNRQVAEDLGLSHDAINAAINAALALYPLEEEE